MARQPEYIIQSISTVGVILYVQIDFGNLAMSFVPKGSATHFQSQSLANGWVLKARIVYPTYQFSVMTL